MTVTKWVLLFYVYCFAGWIWETCYVSVRAGRFCNRGFLHGPFLPIYGSGAMVILLSTFAVRENLWLVYVIGTVSSTILEYLTGEAMQRIFGVRYWDYSGHRFNLKGHICLGVSLGWGLFSVLLVRFINPPVAGVIEAMPQQIAEVLTHALTAVIAVDATVSVFEALDLKRVLREMAEENEKIQELQRRADFVHEMAEEDFRRRKEEFDIRVSCARERAGELLEELHRRGALRNARFARILRRNPGAVSERLRTELEELKKQLEEYRDSRK